MSPFSRLSAVFLRDHSAVAARVLEDFPAESVAEFLAAASPATAGHVVEHFTPGFAASCLISIKQPVAGQIFSQLLPDLQVTLLRLLDRDKRELLLSALQPDLAASLRRLLPYPEGTAGALMEAPLASVQEDLSVREAVKRIKRIRRGMKFYIYATNERGQLTGVLTLHELINARPSTNISQVMRRHVLNLSPTQSIRSVIDSPYWKDYHALPVMDENNLLLGVIHQKGMRRFQEQSVQVGAISGGLGAFIAVGELFSITAGQLLAALISTGTSLKQRAPRD